MTDTPQSYPLQWPAGRPRTARRIRALFHKGRAIGRASLSMSEAVKRLQHELNLLRGCRMPVISTNVALRRDGLPYANQSTPPDPGVAVYFQMQDKPIVLACDYYDRPEDNIAAIAVHIGSLRAMERHHVGSLEQMFAGFTALPPAMAPDDWRGPLGNPQSIEEAEANYRERMKYAHPDVNQSDGAEAVAATLNAAIRAARKAFE